MRLSDLEKYNTITVQCHDNPDADAVGAGYGLYRYFADRGCKVSLIYSGHNKIAKTNLKMMIEQLNIPIEYVSPGRKRHVEGLLLTVDCQYGAGNITGFEADQVAVIDHHPLEIQNIELSRIQANLGSCATLVWSMLREENYSVAGDIQLGTALYYGLYMDTNQFSELFHPLDMDMREDVTIDKRLMTRLRNANISLKELEIAGIAMIRYSYNDDYRFAVIKSQPCDPNLLGLISDFLLQVDVIDTCVVYNELNDGYKVSVRSCIKEVNANELAVFLTEGIGSGGGHYEKAGGFVSMKLYEQKYPTLHSEAYFNNRITEYFESFTIISAKEMKLDISGMKKYIRRNTPLFYVKATDVVAPGASISVRAKNRSIEETVKEDTYFTIEKDGMVHILSEERFLKYHRPGQGEDIHAYHDCMEYEPTIKDWTNDKLYRLVDYAKPCMPTDAFCIYAKVLESSVKLFPKWNEDKYLLGMFGDYLAASAEDLENVFIEPGDKFLERYEEI